jgi:hypothetical protein
MSDTGTTLKDKSGKLNTGTASGATYVKLPSSSGARNFDGSNDYVKAASSTSLNPTGGLTIEALVNVDTLDKLQTLVGKSWSSATGTGYMLRIHDSNKLQFIVYDKNGAKQSIMSSTTLASSSWCTPATSIPMVTSSATSPCRLAGTPIVSTSAGSGSPRVRADCVPRQRATRGCSLGPTSARAAESSPPSSVMTGGSSLLTARIPWPGATGSPPIPRRV